VFEELPEQLPGFPDLRNEIIEMAEIKGFSVAQIYKVDS
jgi:hypothetical protein